MGQSNHFEETYEIPLSWYFSFLPLGSYAKYA